VPILSRNVIAERSAERSAAKRSAAKERILHGFERLADFIELMPSSLIAGHFVHMILGKNEQVASLGLSSL